VATQISVRSPQASQFYPSSATADVGRLKSMTDLSCVPDSISFDVLYDIPLPSTQENPFDQTLDLAAVDKEYQTGGVKIGFDPSTRGTTIDCPFFLCGVGIQAWHYPTSSEILGYAIPTGPVGAQPIDQPAITSLPYGSADYNAVLRVGTDSVIAKDFLFRSQDIRFELGCKYELFKERLGTIGEYGSDGSIGSSSQNADAAEDILRANMHAIRIGKPFQFIETDAVVVGPAGSSTVQGLPVATTRSHWPGKIIKGLHGGRMPVDCFALVPTLAFNITQNPGHNVQGLTRLLQQVASDTPTPTIGESPIFNGNLSTTTVTVTSTVAGLFGATVLPIGTVLTAAAPVAGVPQLVQGTAIPGGQVLTALQNFSLGGTNFSVGQTIASPQPSLFSVAVVSTPIGSSQRVIFKTGALQVRYHLLGCYITPTCLLDWYENFASYAHLELLVSQMGPNAWLSSRMNRFSSRGGDFSRSRHGTAGIHPRTQAPLTTTHFLEWAAERESRNNPGEMWT
jgi:hypothetical protein